VGTLHINNSHKLSDFPSHLDIEVTSRCNLNCTFCDKQPLLKKDQLGDMDFALFRKIIDEGALYGLKSVQLSYRGEPLLHPDIARMIDYAKQKGVEKVFFCTNGMLLTPTMSRELIRAGLDQITVSVQGTNTENFESARLGSKFRTVFLNIRKLMEEKRSLGLKYPHVRVQAVLLPGFNLEEHRKFWEPYCDEVVHVEYRDSLNREKGLKTGWICDQPWKRLTIEWDGTILPCNNDDIREFSPGNAREMTVYDAWHNEKTNTLRQLHLKGESHKSADCDGCSYRALYI